jgi:hypothetical protein
VPSRVVVDVDGNVHRAWLFSNPQGGIRPFFLTQDLIPTGGGEKDIVVTGEFLDNPGETAYFSGAHQSGFFNENTEYISLGVGRNPGGYFRGTIGWAKWVPKALAVEGSDSTAQAMNVDWFGEWQIVTLYADLIQNVKIYSADIPAGERGTAQLWWIDKDKNHTFDATIDPVMENSTYEIQLFNDTGRELKVGEEMKAYFSRPHYVWVPFQPPDTRNFACVQSGWTNTKGAAGVGSWVSETVSVKTCDYDDATTATGDAFNVKTIPHKNLDTALFTNYIIEWALEPNGDKVIVSNIWDDPFGTVKWEAVATANIRDGWKLCDGNNGTVDLRRQFIMSIDPADGAGDGSENTIGDSGGFSDHGGATNDHDDHTDTLVAAAIADHAKADVAQAIADHPTHTHVVSSSGPKIDIGTTTNVVESPTTSQPNTAQAHAASLNNDLAHAAEPGDNDLEHSETDNRPRYYVLAAIQRVS